MQSQWLQAHGSSPFKSRHRLRACAFCTLSRTKYSSQYSFFLERGRTVADFDPLHAAVLQFARVGHVAKVLAACDGALAERAALDRVPERTALSILHARRDEIPHKTILWHSD